MSFSQAFSALQKTEHSVHLTGVALTLSGSLLAAATEAELYENFTDVDSVFAANPTIVDNPIAIDKMTYREMRELAYAGFSVFHDEALMPAFRRSVPVCIKNTNNPEAPGTMIVKERNHSAHPVIGIAADSGFSTLFVDKYLMNQEIGFGQTVTTNTGRGRNSV